MPILHVLNANLLKFKISLIFNVIILKKSVQEIILKEKVVFSVK